MNRVTRTIDRLRRPEYTGENRCLPCTVVNAALAALAATGVGSGLVVAGVSAAYAAGVAAGVLGVSAVSIYLRGYLVPGTPALTKRYFPPWLLSLFGKDPEPSAGTEGGAIRADAAIGADAEPADGSDDRAADEPDGQGARDGATERAADPSASDDDPDDGADDASGAAPPDDRVVALDVEALLLDAGILVEHRDGEDLRLESAFAAALSDRAAAVREADADRAALREVLGADEDVEIEFEEHGDAFRAESDGLLVGTWESRAAFVGDVAAGRLLADRLPAWESLSAAQRGELLQGARLFLEECPGCEGPLSFDTATVESCCTTREVAALNCDDCERRLFEAPVREDAAAD